MKTMLLAVWILGAGFQVTWATPPAVSEWIEGLEGAWYAETGTTPMGAMGFALVFDREDDGSVHGRAVHDRDTWVDLRFRRTDEGRWLLDQGASMSGLGEQGSTLVPAGIAGPVKRWVLDGDPDFLAVDFEPAPAGNAFGLRVWLRGRSHVAFDLRRADPATEAELRRGFEARADREPRDPLGGGSGDADSGADGADPIAKARAGVEANPDDPGAHALYARALREAIVAEPALGARLAADLLEALRTTLRLDPTYVPAYHELVGYYLDAPPIAGGSVDRAEDVALRLQEIEPAAGAELLATVRAARERRSADR